MESGGQFEQRSKIRSSRPCGLARSARRPVQRPGAQTGGPFALDLQLRALPQASDGPKCWKAHATLHLGHAMVIELHIDENCQFWLAGQATQAEGSEFREPYTKFFKSHGRNHSRSTS